MCLCVWNNLSMERDKGLHQGVEIMGGLGRVLVGGDRNLTANEVQQSRAAELKGEKEALGLNMAIC